MAQAKINVNTNKPTELHKLSIFILIILAASTVFSPLRAMPHFNQFWAIGMIGWYLITAQDIPKFLFKSSFYNIVMWFFIFYTIIVSYLFGNDRIGNRFFEISQMFLYYSAYKKNRYIGRFQDSLLIIKIIIPLVIISSIATVSAYHSDPYISRSIKTGSEMSNDIMLRGIGGYELVYFLTLVVPMILNLVYYRQIVKNRKVKLLLFFMLILFCVNIVLSNYSIALLLLISSAFISIFIKKLNFRWIIFYFIIILLILIFELKYVAYFFSSLTNLFGHNMNAKRMAELSQLAINNTAGTSIVARINAYYRSVAAFLENPFFGVISNNLNLKYGVTGFGQHSQILDTFALFGLFLGLIQLYLFSNPFLIRMRTNNILLKKTAFIVFFNFILLTSLDVLTTSIGFAAFFIFPTVYDWIDRQYILDTKDPNIINNKNYEDGKRA